MVKQKRTINKVDRSIYIYMIKLNMSDIIIPIVRDNESKDPTLCCL